MFDDFREDLVMPAGHPVSWGALVAGTCLEGTPYPLPVFGHSRWGAVDARSARNQAAETVEAPPAPRARKGAYHKGIGRG